MLQCQYDSSLDLVFSQHGTKLAAALPQRVETSRTPVAVFGDIRELFSTAFSDVGSNTAQERQSWIIVKEICNTDLHSSNWGWFPVWERY